MRAARTSVGSASSKPKGARLMPSSPQRFFSKSDSDEGASHVNASAVGEFMPSWPKHGNEPSLAERRHRAAPSNIHVESNTKGPKKSLKPQMKETIGLMSPLHCEHITDWSTTEDDSSRGRYSLGERHPSQEPEPLKLQPRKYEPPPAPRQQRPAPRDRSPEKWANTDTYVSSRALQQGIRCSSSPRRMQSNAEQLRYHDLTHERTRDGQLPLLWEPVLPTRAEAIASVESPLFSPLACYFRGPDFPSEKKGGKTMIGDNGWLERTEVHDGTRRSPSKRIGIIEGIKKIAKDMVRCTDVDFASKRLTASRPSFTTPIADTSPYQRM